jgi:hypothetical protein
MHMLKFLIGQGHKQKYKYSEERTERKTKGVIEVRE